LVDELQDFGLEALRLIAALSPIANGLTDPLCVVGDGHQRIYNKTPIALSRAGINVRGRSRRLKINYRTTEQIRQWAHGLLAGMEIDDLDGGVANTLADQSVMRGAEPKFVDCKSFDEAASAVTAWIKGLQESGIGSHEICFTPPNKVLVTALQSAGIKTLELQARQPDPGQDEPGVRYGTKQRIKGLEFKAVALLMHRHTSENQECYANYVAATRAREHLLIVDVN
jgi:superfamily I DNA/RNA helicase